MVPSTESVKLVPQSSKKHLQCLNLPSDMAEPSKEEKKSEPEILEEAEDTIDMEVLKHELQAC